MTYAEKNHGIITFHKMLCFRQSPAAYKAIHEDLLGIEPEEEKDAFILGRAIEDYIYGKTDEYEVVARRGESSKTQLTRAQGTVVEKSSAEMLANPFGAPKGAKERVEIMYSGERVGGEIDELYLEKWETNGMQFDGYIADYKSCASFESAEKFMEQYIEQIAYYQFITQVAKDIDANRIAGMIKLVTKDSFRPMSKVILITPQTLLSYRPHLLGTLDKLVKMK